MLSMPERQGLYDLRNERDACGVGSIANIPGQKSDAIIGEGLQILANLDHRGAVGAGPLIGDGTGCLIQIPDALLCHSAEGNALTLRRDQDAFERKLLAFRKQTLSPRQELAARKQLPGIAEFYIPRFLSRSVAYKSLLLATQVGTSSPASAPRRSTRISRSRRGQPLVGCAIREGRECAEAPTLTQRA